MGEKMGLLFTVAIFAMGLLPFLLDMFTFNVQTTQFLNAATEMQQLVTEEGGITDRVRYVQDHTAITYVFTNEAGEVVNGNSEIGEVIYIDYRYKWKGLFSEQLLKTANTVRVARR